MTYVTGFLTPVKSEDKARYVKSAEASWPLFQKYGALSQVETWGEDVPDGKLTSFPKAVKLEPGEVVVFSWVTWPDRATADAFRRNILARLGTEDTMTLYKRFRGAEPRIEPLLRSRGLLKE